MRRWKKSCCWLMLLFVGVYPARADMLSAPKPGEKSPSKDQILWTQTTIGYVLEAQYDYVGAAHTDFGNGHEGDVSEEYTDLRHVFTYRALLAFLFHFGLEWQRMGFAPPDNVFVPNELDSLNGFLAADFRWSTKSLMRLQFEPGYFSDNSTFMGPYFNCPIALAYTRVVSNRFQWAFGVSYNNWRSSHFLPGGGFRYQLTDRWKLKFMLPSPAIEYKANEWLHTWVGADFIGNTFRVARNFGDVHNQTSLNGTLVDYQEIRVGTGLSWNIKPLIELNAETGYMAQRQFNFHDADIKSMGRGAPYISLNLRILFQLVKDERPMETQVRAMQVEFPALQQFLKVPGL